MSPTPTDRLGLNGYDEDERWKEEGTVAFSGDPDGHNDTVALFDELAVDRGPIADRPASGEYDDEMFYAVDQRTLWRWDAGESDWKAAAGLGTENNPIPNTTHFEAVSAEDGVNGVDFEVFEDIDDVDDLPDPETIDQPTIGYIESGVLADDYIGVFQE